MLTKNTDKLRTKVAKHLAADALTRGKYWDDESGNGGFIGCLTHSRNAEPAFKRFGLPVTVLHIAQNIFEALPDGQEALIDDDEALPDADEGRAFFAALPDAVGRDGKDLNRVHWAFLAAELRALPQQPDDIQAVVDPVIAGMDLLAVGKEWTTATSAALSAYAAGRAAANAAYAADDDSAEAANARVSSDSADAAAYAARAAALAADADYALAAAYAATDAARTARAAARSAAYSAAYAAAYTNRAATDATDAAVVHAALRQRDTLLALIAAA